MKQELLITNCTDPLMWYVNKVGQRVPFIRTLGSENSYLSRDDGGYSNIVLMKDCEVVDVCLD